MNKIKLAFLALIGFSVISCSWGPDSLDETRDQILTVAYKSDTVNFSVYQTFAIADSMTVINNGTKTRVLNDTSTTLKTNIISSLQKEGLTQVDPTEAYDLAVDYTFIQKTNVDVYPGAWSDGGWWWPGFYWNDIWYQNYYSPWCGYYPYYPYHYPFVVSSYRTGTFIIEIADVTKVPAALVTSGTDVTNKATKVPIVWHGIIREIKNHHHTWQQMVNSTEDLFNMLPLK